MSKDLKEKTLDLLTRLLEGNMVSVVGDEMIQEFISTEFAKQQEPETQEGKLHLAQYRNCEAMVEIIDHASPHSFCPKCYC